MFTKDGNTIVITRAFAAPVENLFAAWSNPEIFKSWWKEIAVVEMDFREGGSYRMQWKNCGENAKVGVFRQIIPQKSIVFTWNGTGEWTNTKDNLITLTFHARGANASELELKHEFSNDESTRDDHHEGWTWAMLDLDTHFNAPLRKINQDLKVQVAKTYSFPVEKVFAAWTNSSSLAKWFNRDGATMGRAHTEAKVGTTFFMDYQQEDGRLHRLYGTYAEVVPNQKLSFSWIEDSSSERVSPDYGYPTAVTVLFQKMGPEQTKVEVTHSKLSSEPLMKNFEGGWTSCLNGVDAFLKVSV